MQTFLQDTNGVNENRETQESSEQEHPGWYRQILDDYDYQRPTRGEVLDGKIISIYDDAILVDLGLKRDAIVPSQEVNKLDNDVLDNLAIGDRVKVYVSQAPIGDRELLVSIQKALNFVSWEKAEQDLAAGTLLDLEIIGWNRGGLVVRYETLEGFVPNSHIQAMRGARGRHESEEKKRELVGSRLQVKAIEVESGRQRLVFSERAAQSEVRQQRLQELAKGQILRGTVVNTVDFGVFVDLGEVDGMVHKSELSWGNLDSASAELSVGDEIEVQVLEVDRERERVSLSRKVLLPNPWKLLAEKHEPGSLMTGEVTKVLDFGAFVHLQEGVEGLVHVSQLGYTAPGSPDSVVVPGEKVLVKVLYIDVERERISLSMRQVPVEEQISWMIERSEQAPPEEQVDSDDIQEADTPQPVDPQEGSEAVLQESEVNES